MPDTDKITQIQKKTRPVIAFRHSSEIKDRMQKMASKLNIDPAAHNRNVFNAGLNTLYGYKIVGNELVESDAVNQSSVSS